MHPHVLSRPSRVFAAKIKITTHSSVLSICVNPKKNELLEVILEQVLQKIFGEPRDLTLRMKYLKKFGFYHGSFLADSLPVGTFMYFEGIQMGMVAIATNLTGDVSYARFTDEIVMDGSFTGKKHSLETQ